MLRTQEYFQTTIYMLLLHGQLKDHAHKKSNAEFDSDQVKNNFRMW